MNTHVPGQHNHRQLASRALIMNTHVPGQHNHRQLASRALIMNTHVPGQIIIVNWPRAHS